MKPEEQVKMRFFPEKSSNFANFDNMRVFLLSMLNYVSCNVFGFQAFHKANEERRQLLNELNSVGA